MDVTDSSLSHVFDAALPTTKMSDNEHGQPRRSSRAAAARAAKAMKSQQKEQGPQQRRQRTSRPRTPSPPRNDANFVGWGIIRAPKDDEEIVGSTIWTDDTLELNEGVMVPPEVFLHLAAFLPREALLNLMRTRKFMYKLLFPDLVRDFGFDALFAQKPSRVHSLRTDLDRNPFKFGWIRNLELLSTKITYVLMIHYADDEELVTKTLRLAWPGLESLRCMLDNLLSSCDEAVPANGMFSNLKRLDVNLHHMGPFQGVKFEMPQLKELRMDMNDRLEVNVLVWNSIKIGSPNLESITIAAEVPGKTVPEDLIPRITEFELWGYQSDLFVGFIRSHPDFRPQKLLQHQCYVVENPSELLQPDMCEGWIPDNYAVVAAMDCIKELRLYWVSTTCFAEHGLPPNANLVQINSTYLFAGHRFPEVKNRLTKQREGSATKLEIFLNIPSRIYGCDDTWKDAYAKCVGEGKEWIAFADEQPNLSVLNPDAIEGKGWFG